MIGKNDLQFHVPYHRQVYAVCGEVYTVASQNKYRSRGERGENVGKQ
jgi:hypothetical protein